VGAPVEPCQGVARSGASVGSQWPLPPAALVCAGLEDDLEGVTALILALFGLADGGIDSDHAGRGKTGQGVAARARGAVGARRHPDPEALVESQDLPLDDVDHGLVALGLGGEKLVNQIVLVRDVRGRGAPPLRSTRGA